VSPWAFPFSIKRKDTFGSETLFDFPSVQDQEKKKTLDQQLVRLNLSSSENTSEKSKASRV
jgi:hypothetical protein